MFVSGCYDILHAGHVQFFHEARSLGSHLTVSFAGEAVLFSHKQKRSSLPDEHKAGLIGALECVDEVVVGDSLDVLGLDFIEHFRRIRPHYLAVTEDDKYEQVRVGAALHCTPALPPSPQCIPGVCEMRLRAYSPPIPHEPSLFTCSPPFAFAFPFPCFSFLLSPSHVSAHTDNAPATQTKRALCDEVGCQYVRLPKTPPSFTPISTTAILNGIRAPDAGPCTVCAPQSAPPNASIFSPNPDANNARSLLRSFTPSFLHSLTPSPPSHSATARRLWRRLAGCSQTCSCRRIHCQLCHLAAGEPEPLAVRALGRLRRLGCLRAAGGARRSRQ